MKKLGKLKLNSLASLSREEQKSIIGGDWIWDPDLKEYVYELDEVTVYGYKECPACKAARQYIKDNESLNDPDANTWRYIIVGIEHIIGCCGHR